MVHNVADLDNVIGISYNRALEILSQPGKAVSGSVCEKCALFQDAVIYTSCMCQRREGIGNLKPFLKHKSMIALLRSASELSRFT